MGYSTSQGATAVDIARLSAFTDMHILVCVYGSVGVRIAVWSVFLSCLTGNAYHHLLRLALFFTAAWTLILGETRRYLTLP